MQAYMTIFGQEGIGRPDSEIANEIELVKNFFSKQLNELEIPDIRAAIIFTNDQAEIDITDAPLPVMKLKQLKDFFRQKAKEKPVDSLMLDKLKSILPAE